VISTPDAAAETHASRLKVTRVRHGSCRGPFDSPDVRVLTLVGHLVDGGNQHT
jgi:hypothetical protein